MCNLAELSPSEVNKLTKADIIAEIFKDVRRSSASREEDEHGNAVRQEETITDAYGTVVGTREILWTYYKTGEVNVITVRDFDASHKLLGGYTVKHYRGEQQPRLNPIEPGPK